jgi:hypothetical protein
VADTLVVRTGAATARELAAWSRGAMDMALDGGAELWAHEATTEALVLGAFERADGAHVSPVFQRGSGGASVLVAPGTIHVALVLRHSAELTECAPDKIVNRYVRPLLRALTGLGATARYFGRDWISVEHTPVAWVGFGHDATTGRSLFEAFVAGERAFAPAGRPTFMGKEPGTLRDVVQRSTPPARIVEAVVTAYGRAYGEELVRRSGEPPALGPGVPGGHDDVPDETPWRATSEDVMGTVGAGPDREGRLRIGGALFASRDALHGIEVRASSIGPDAAEMVRMVDEVFQQAGVVLHGVRSPRTLSDLLLRAGM